MRTICSSDLNIPFSAPYILPAFRGKCKCSAFPIARYRADATLTEDTFLTMYANKNAAWIPECNDIDTLYNHIDALPDHIYVLGIANIGIFACGLTPAQADARLQPGAAVKTSAVPSGTLQGRIIIITGAAQGFGKGIAQELLDAGAYVVLSDINQTTLSATAQSFASQFGADRVYAVPGDVTSDESIDTLCRHTVLHYGGIDAMISNAGIVTAGDLEHMTSETMTKVSDINYVGYFRCTRSASRYMKIQSAFDPTFTADILQINSIAGLVGYPKNFAYCGSKFGALGMTECFAKELIPYRIKVNAICPGNYYEGPLWNDPKKGLFVQYLKAGKIPGGKTVEDSIRYYMDKEPFHRGCTPKDVAKAVIYCIDQQFETGVSIPVTGGLAMGAL